MNPKEYAEKAIHLSPITLRKDLSIDEAAALVFRGGYPEPQYGVDLFYSHRGDANNGIDWPLKHLRRGFAELIENVAEDCVSVVANLEDVDEGTKTKIAAAIRNHFEIVVH
jgi:hypothetical protein